MDTKISPVFMLRSYAWDLLKSNTNMDEGDYGGKIPIVPVGEEPELSQYSGPHLVYGYALNPVGDPQNGGSMTFVIYSQNFGAITDIINIFNEAFGRQDESARSINAYTSKIPAYVGIRFGTVSVGFVEGGTPETDENAAITEGGRQSGMVNIQFTYVPNYDVNVDPTPTVTPVP